MPTLEEIVKAEHDVLALETQIAGCPPFVAANDLDDVRTRPSILRYPHPAVVNPLAGAKGTAFVVDCASLKSKVLWVGTANDEYRKDYLLFLNANYNLGLSSIPTKFDVDHLFNRSRAKAYSLQFIRVALVDFAANRSHGAAYEKDITINEAMRSRKTMYLMDEMSSMKYFGFLSPLRDDPRDSEINAYATFAASRLGLNRAEVIKSIEYLRKTASTPWARRNP